jgi:hypothetical protein
MTAKLVALTVALTAAGASVAHAQAPGETSPVSSDAGPKDPDTALMLSLGGTLASHAIMFAGLAADNGDLVLGGLATGFFAPSFGEWYAGKPLTAGMGIRAASAFVTVAGVAEGLKCLDFEGSDTSCHSGDSAGILIAGGLIGYAAGSIYDIATAPRAAREYNRTHAVTVQPSLLRTPSGTTSVGVGIGGTF